MTSKIEDVLSSLHRESDRGLNNLILSSVLLSMAKTKTELRKLIDRTLMKLQEKRLCINVEEITEKAISDLLEKGILIGIHKEINSDLLEDEKISDDTELDLSHMGKAAMKGIFFFTFLHGNNSKNFIFNYKNLISNFLTQETPK